MPLLNHARRSRRLSRKSPVEAADYDWQGTASLHSGFNAFTPPSVYQTPPSPSTCTSSSSSDSPSSFITHLPFTPGSSHTRNRKQGHIPRPPNAFMVFRSWLWNKDNLKSIERDNRNVSRIAGRYWNELSEEERAPFRYMAEQAKARHAQLYPEYRYSPGSQKKTKTSQRRSHRCAEIENERCDKVVNLLKGGVATRDLADHLGQTHNNVQPDQSMFPLTLDGSLSDPPNAVPRNNKLKRPAPPQEGSPTLPPRSKKQKTFPHSLSVTPPPPQYPLSLPVFPNAKERSEPAQFPGPSARTPELSYPLDCAEEFVPTEDIPYIPLESCNYSTVKKSDQDDLFTLFPSHMSPGAQSVFSGVKPEASSFVDSCMLGAYTIDAPVLPNPIPFTGFDIGACLSPDSELVPLGSPVFSNPFELFTPSAEHAALFGTLDQLFGQSISPLTQVFPTENW